MKNLYFFTLHICKIGQDQCFSAITASFFRFHKKKCKIMLMPRILKADFRGDVVIKFSKFCFPVILKVVQPLKLCSTMGNDLTIKKNHLLFAPYSYMWMAQKKLFQTKDWTAGNFLEAGSDRGEDEPLGRLLLRLHGGSHPLHLRPLIST